MLVLWSDEEHSDNAYKNCSLISISVGVAHPCGIVVAKDGCGFGLCASRDILEAECVGERRYSFCAEDFSAEGGILWCRCCAELVLLGQSEDDSWFGFC
jgi:hypothetical protein